MNVEWNERLEVRCYGACGNYIQEALEMKESSVSPLVTHHILRNVWLGVPNTWSQCQVSDDHTGLG